MKIKSFYELKTKEVWHYVLKPKLERIDCKKSYCDYLLEEDKLKDCKLCKQLKEEKKKLIIVILLMKPKNNICFYCENDIIIRII